MSRQTPAIPTAFSLTLVVFSLATCMKAERLGTDTNSPDGLALGGWAEGSAAPAIPLVAP